MEEKIISVSQLTQAIKSVLEEGFGDVTVSGEISNFKAHSSGHRYFTLKDEGAAISCVMWRGRNLTFAPTDGMKVVARGRLSVYPPRGNYQLDCFSLSPQGQGDLFLAFEALKKKLGEAGYFAPERKRALPALPMKIGVATSPTGAAVRDIMSTIERRFPAANIYFRPAIVQGDEAGPDVALSIRELAATNADIIIIGRGGGSLEDLWAFNTEIVADAIFKCPVPVISAVGHETDFTIADFTADVRAATPTAAAELATPTPAAELIRGIAQYQQLMTSNISNKIALHKDAVAMLLRRRAERRVIEKIRMRTQQTDEAEGRMRQSLRHRLSSYSQRSAVLEERLRALYPLSPLRRGFALLKTPEGILSKDKSLAEFKKIEIIRENESARAKIEQILPRPLFD